jgi:hypothetical protein
MLINFLKQVKMAVINLKKKPGRPKKVKNDHVVIMKSDTEIKLEKAEATLSLKDKIIADLEEMLDNSYKEQEDMLSQLKTWINMFPNAFRELEKHAGKITSEDVIYHANLIVKIMEHKFGNKSKNSEE